MTAVDFASELLVNPCNFYTLFRWGKRRNYLPRISIYITGLI